MNSTGPAMKLHPSALLILLLVAGCDDSPRPKPAAFPSTPGSPLPQADPPAPTTLAEARRGFQTRIIKPAASHEPIPEPPAGAFQTVRFDSPAGKLAAYLGPDPGDGKKHPAIVWIFGGFDNSIGDPAWVDGPPENDQSASAFRKAGLVMMYPALRGGNDHPGPKEAFYGEVDDVLAAAEFLAHRDYVDPARIYLGGHSTGGTLALLAAESTDRFRAVFAFGAADDVSGYGADELPFDLSNPREIQLRSPVLWLAGIRNPVFLLEGSDGNVGSLRTLAAASRNPLVHAYTVPNATHFSVLAPTTRLIAEKVVRDDGPACNITLSQDELDRLMRP